MSDLFETIDQFDVTDDEFWHALNFIAGGAPEFGLWAAGLGLEHFLDIRADLKDQAEGITQGTPRTIEGPLYVAGAPLLKAEARLDDGSDDGSADGSGNGSGDDDDAPDAGVEQLQRHEGAFKLPARFDPLYGCERRLTLQGGSKSKLLAQIQELLLVHTIGHWSHWAVRLTDRTPQFG